MTTQSITRHAVIIALSLFLIVTLQIRKAIVNASNEVETAQIEQQQ